MRTRPCAEKSSLERVAEVSHLSLVRLEFFRHGTRKSGEASVPVSYVHRGWASLLTPSHVEASSELAFAGA